MRPPLMRLAAVAALAFGMGAVGASAGNAATAAQKCTTVSGTAKITPGLGSTPADQTVVAKGNETGCTPSAKTGGTGALKATVHIAESDCTTLVNGGQSFTGTGSSTWANGKVSKYSLSFKTGTGNNVTVATITGTVTSGLFKGKSLTGQIQFTIKGSPNCTTTPVTKLSFTNTKPFVIS